MKPSQPKTVVSAIAIIMTTAIDGLVAGIVKLDDGGLALIKATAKNSRGDFKHCLGNAMLLATVSMLSRFKTKAA
jgi:predicted DNA repair protein MutK